MRQFWKSFKQLCKDLWGFYDVIYYTAFKRNCNEITFQEGTYALESRQKRKLRSLLIGNFIIMGIAIYLGGRLTEMLFAVFSIRSSCDFRCSNRSGSHLFNTC